MKDMKKQIINYNALQSVTIYDKILNTDIIYGSYRKNFKKRYGFTDNCGYEIYNVDDLKSFIIEDNIVYYKPKIEFIFMNNEDNFHLIYDSYELAEKDFEVFKTEISKNLISEFNFIDSSLIFYK